MAVGYYLCLLVLIDLTWNNESKENKEKRKSNWQTKQQTKTNTLESNNFMKTKRSSILTGMLAISMLQFAAMNSLAQTVATNGNILIVNNFDTAYQVTNNGGFAWQNWYGTAYSNVLWSADDASNNPNSGSLEIVSFFPDAGVSGANGPQFLAIDGFGPFNPALNGNGAPTNYVITNFTCDVRILPFSVTNASGQYPLLEFGTMTTNYSTAYDFGSLQLTSAQTNWVHVSLPLAPSANWAQIPGVFIKSYSSLTGVDVVEVDNLEFQYGTPPANTPGTVIGSWQGTGSALAPAPDEGWIDWGNGLSITNTANTNKYQFVAGAVAGYTNSLQIAQGGYNQSLAIKLEYLPGGVSAFLTNHLLSLTFSVPPAAASGATSGFSQLYQLVINASGYGFKSQPFTNFSETGNTSANQSGMPNFYFYSGAPAQSQVVTVNYSSILPLITARPSGGYIEIIFAFNNGSGAPTNWFVNNVVLSGGPVSTNITISGASYLPSGPSFVLTWNATAGASYSVLKTNTLVGTPANYWPAIVMGYPGTNGATGGPLSYTDTTATVSPAFYRVTSP